MSGQSAAVHPPWSCRYCDRRVASRIQAKGGCRPCRAVATSMCDLGLAIRRFVRRAEVAELVETLTDEAQNYGDACAERLPNTRREAYAKLCTAHDRLAELALEDR